MFKKILIYFLSWKILIYLAAIAIAKIIPSTSILINFNSGVRFIQRLPYLVWVWGNFDGIYYLGIARRGYFNYEYPFFPLYPLFIRFLAKLAHITNFMAGQLISNGAFIGALFIMTKLFIKDGKKLINLFLLLFFVYPTAFFYQAIYNDSLFLFFAVTTIYYARQKKFLTASIFGALATLTRLNGLVLAFLIVFEYFTGNESIKTQWQLAKVASSIRNKVTVKNIFQSQVFFVLLVPLAFLGYLIYIQLLTGTWTSVFTSMKIWNQDKVIFPLQVVWRYIKILATAEFSQVNYWVAFEELSFVMLYLTAIIYAYKKIRLSYWLFFAISILIPTLTGTFQGMPRYGLHLYPFFLTLYLFLEKKNTAWKFTYFLVCIILFLINLALFTRGYFIA